MGRPVRRGAVVVMLIIPLSFIGVIFGHIAMGLDFTMPSLLGFVAMAGAWDKDLRRYARAAVRRHGLPVSSGVYAFVRGPAFETAAEVGMIGQWGADAVGMSTVPEAIALRHMGIEVAAISLVTNLAAGISPTPLSHDEVTETAARARERFTAVLDLLLPKLAAAS